MVFRQLGVGLLIAVTAASCGGNATPQSPSPQQGSLAERRTGQENPPRQRPDNQAVARQTQAGPSIPRDARWTIFCTTFSGPSHVAEGRSAREKLMRSTPLTGWYTVSGEERTVLYYGYYRAIRTDPRNPDDKAESERAQADRRAVQQIFRTAFFVELDAPDPTSPPEWDLANAPPEALYTVQIGVYKGSPDRRAKAVEAVREARQKYNVEAYYHHGPTGSAICIGAWPPSAVRENNPMKFRAQQELAHGVPVLVPAGIDVPEGAVARDGTPLNVIKATFEVLDPTLRQTLRQYDTHSVNGEQRVLIDPRTGARRVEKLPSRIVRIPGRMTAQERLVEAQQHFRKGQARPEDLPLLQDAALVQAQDRFLKDQATPQDLALLQRVVGEDAAPVMRDIASAGPFSPLGDPAAEAQTPGDVRPSDASSDTARPPAVLRPPPQRGGRLRSIND